MKWRDCKCLGNNEKKGLWERLEKNKEQGEKEHEFFQRINERVCRRGRDHRTFSSLVTFEEVMLFHGGFSLNSFRLLAPFMSLHILGPR